MAPNPAKFVPNNEELTFRKTESTLTGEEIVISGIAGIFPKCNSVQEFMNNLYNKVDMVTRDEKPSFIHPEMPKYHGIAEDFHMFDAQFLRVPYGQAKVMDPITRKLLENVYCALFDAGVNPNTLAGTKLGVFVGSSYNEISNVNLYNLQIDSNYLITGCSKTMQANRISYWLDGKGPSITVEMGCSSSMLAFEEALRTIKHGQCDSAIVTGSNNIIDPMLSFNMRRAGLLSLDGKTKCFDKNGDGYVRSEAVPVFFLQRASDAKRIYAEVVHIKHGYIKPDKNFLPIHKSDDIEELIRKFYSEINISPNDVEYLEACGTGIAEADANELEAINRIFANGKSIKIGSVKSNMGHSDGAADACSVIKACLAYHKGEIPGNLHYSAPQDDITGVRDGKIQVITDNTPFKRGYAAFNSFSYTGTSYHALTKGHYKKKELERYYSSIPRLILASGRTENSLIKIFDNLESRTIDAEEIALLHNFFTNNISGHTFRGYTILDTNDDGKTEKLAQSISHNSGVTNPVWFLYSGMGSQWPGMGVELMKIPRFAASIDRCRKILVQKGIDIVQIITNTEKNAFDNILYAFVGITAMQVALTDLLTEMGIVPDNIIGHSLGEHGCAYADGCFTVEETILVSYYRGLISLETNSIKGMMAAVALGHEEVSLLCPPEIEVACHNSPTSSTISGPAEIVKKFVADLNAKGVFAKGVQTANIAYHSKYIAAAGPRLLSTLTDVIKTPKLRSAKWLCTSAPPEKWNQEDVKYASAKYLTNNLLGNVYFHEAAKNIPENAIIIEVSPHGLMQAILRRSHSTCANIPLTKQNNLNPIKFLLEAVGKLYEAGLNPKINFLYPKVQFPVSTETPMLSHLVGWAHDGDWESVSYKKGKPVRKSSRRFAMTLNNDDWQYFQGHVRDGDIIFPESAFLVLVWETLAMQLGRHYSDVSVTFENISFNKELYLSKDEIIRLTIAIQIGNNEFEIYQDEVSIVTGFVHHVSKPKRVMESKMCEFSTDDIFLTAKDIYTLFAIKDYSYKDVFKSIVSTNTKFSNANIKWVNNWVTFLDALIQLNILSKDHDGLSIPKLITKLTIDTTLHNQTENILPDGVVTYNATHNNLYGTTRCGGVLIQDLTFYDKTKVNRKSHIDYMPVDNLGLENLNIALIRTNNSIDHFDNWSWTENHNKFHSQNTVQVSYAGLSLYDYQNIIGKGNDTKTYGMDFSGYNYRGERVMGLVPGGALASTVEADTDFVWPVPEHWSLEDAATVPLHYTIAYYCLAIRGRLHRNESVLIVGGAGALGQAVISICLSLECKVFTTVSNNEKKQLLLKIFPQLNEEYILCTSDFLNLRATVARYTHNSLCNYVISCATGQSREDAMKCVGGFGEFMNVNSHDEVENMMFGPFFCTKSRAYKAIRLAGIFRLGNLNQKKTIHRLISEGIAQGIVKPLTRVVYSPTTISMAFRSLISRKRSGRVLIRMDDFADRQNLNLLTRVSFPPEASYLIIGCENVLAVELADWIVKRGAKHVILHQRNKTLDSYIYAKRESWNKYEVFSKLFTSNLQNYEDCDNLLSECEKLGPVLGIFINHLENENNEELERLVSNIDIASRTKCNLLSHFVITSDTKLSGSEDMTSGIERICKKRNDSLLPGFVIHMDAINEENDEAEKLSSFLNILERCIKYRHNKLTKQDSIKNDSQNFLTQIYRILGYNENDNFKDNTSLNNLNINDFCLDEIRNLVNKTFKIDYSKAELQHFTLDRFKNMCNGLQKSKPDGFRAFYNFIDDDEIQSGEPIVRMPSKVANCKSLRAEELDSKETHLIMIPGFEGHSRIFSSIGEMLKIEAVTLQLSPDLEGNSIREMAEGLFKQVKKTFEFESKFYILGYSFGVNIALELADLLEKEGHLGIVFCLDSSPASVPLHLDAYLGKLTEIELQNLIITEIFEIMTRKSSEVLYEELQNHETWAKKVEVGLKNLKQYIKYSRDYQKAILDSTYKRITLSRDYDPNLKLKSEIVLMRSISHPRAKTLSDDYNLSKYSEKPVKVFQIESDHQSAPYYSGVSNIVNKMLEPELIEKYKNMNLCDIYFEDI